VGKRKIYISILFVLLSTFILFQASAGSDVENHGFRFGGAFGWVGSLPVGGWAQDIDFYMDERAFGNGLTTTLLFHIINKEPKSGIGIVPFPILAVVLEYDHIFSGHFHEIIYTGGTWETYLNHRFFNLTGGIRVYPIKFVRAWTPFFEYVVGFHNSSFTTEAGDDNTSGNPVINNDEDSEVENGTGAIHKISIGHDFRFTDNIGLFFRTTLAIGSDGILEPLAETWMFPDYYTGGIRSFEFRLQLYFLTK